MNPTEIDASFVKVAAISSMVSLATCNVAWSASEPAEERQIHLSKVDQINQGAFYTPQNLVDIAYDMIERHVVDYRKYTLLDTSGGYGSFLENSEYPIRVGGDIDPKAVAEARKRVPDAQFFLQDALVNVNRRNYGLKKEDKIIIVGNPPYNDTTSIIRSDVKEKSFSCDRDLKHRDMGMSFLLSYNKLEADYICVLHPLSYLIKKANFRSIKKFTQNYRLKDAVVIPSTEFEDVSKATVFPIIIAFYERSKTGMVYDDILNFRFKTIDEKMFFLGKWSGIGEFVQKYPNQKRVKESDIVAKFYTLRDINALKRSKTFMEKTGANTVFVLREQLKYYCYLDVFKDYIPHIPYYFGNCDPMIDNDAFLEVADCFIYASWLKNPKLNLWPGGEPPTDYEKKIENYFKKLLGEHYVD